MFYLSDVRPLSDFKRSRAELLQHVKTSRRSLPLTLTLNGTAEVVIQDAPSYQMLLEEVGGARDVLSDGKTAARSTRSKPSRRR
jgi:hypothetical protein